MLMICDECFFSVELATSYYYYYNITVIHSKETSENLFMRRSLLFIPENLPECLRKNPSRPDVAFDFLLAKFALVPPAFHPSVDSSFGS